MKFSMNSPVKGFSPEEIMGIFDFSFLSELSPPMMKPEAVVYEGNRPGAKIHFRLKTPFGKKDWKGEINGYGETPDEIWFSDEGKEIPFGIKTWHHKHRLIKTEYGTKIRDEVEVTFKNALLTPLLAPGIWLQFLYRKPLYSKIIAKRLQK